MSGRNKPARVVAELGRPETPEETAARKAQNSRNHRDRQTTRNLVLALLASMGVVILLVLIVPRGDFETRPNVDYQAIAVEAQSGIETPLVVPDLPERWDSNAAELRTGAADGVTSWYIGFLTPANDYVGLSQGIDANPTWVSTELDSSRATGTVLVDDLEWTVYDYRDASNRGNLEYSLSVEVEGVYYLIYGTADPDEASVLASAVTAQIEEQR